MKNTQKKTSKRTFKKTVKQKTKLKDHTENDFTGCEKLITNIGGRRIVLDKKQQKELLEFIYAIGTC